ncbi:MAG: metallophosphoesterase [Cyanobacteria bacterium CRU_2_1]|nr:metallophosphoesterase [Cyanobacteria bacterium RU_5_0]NJR59916.1 metallophosphoesterase [Cyanobacteria bacterium CRU_2_1]
MRLWRSFPQLLIRFLLGLCLSLILNACQLVQPPAPVAVETPGTPTPETVVQAPSPTPLSPETQAIVDSVPNGLFDPPRGDVRFVVISDLNGVYGSTDYDPEVDKGVALIPFWHPDMVVCSGDMVAGQDPTLSEEQLRAMWAAFDDHVAAPLRQANLPYGFTIGNHDASGALGVGGSFLFDRERNVATEYWQDPAHDPGIVFVDRFEFPFYYTFKYNDIFFLAWDGSASHIPQEKLAWVEQALASEEAQSAKLRILLGHLPLYAVAIGRNEPAEVMENADTLREMLERYNVHTYISGHHHAYYPAHKGELQLLHMGILGSGPRPLIDSQSPPRKALTVLDIKFDSPELTTYTTYDIQTLELIEYDELPRFLTGHNGMVMRRDIDELTAEERSVCTGRLNAELCIASTIAPIMLQS